MTDRLDKIEIRIAYLEAANSQLSDTIYRQQQELDTLRMRLAALVGRMDSAQAQPTAYSPEDEKPPHY
jgi:SlyX protein